MAKINKVLAEFELNITGQYLSTDAKVGYVITDINKEYNKKVIKALKNVEGTIKFRVLCSRTTVKKHNRQVYSPI